MGHLRHLPAPLLLLLAGPAPATTPGTAPGDPPRAPNVLLIVADDLGFSDLGAYGGEIPTPNLDRLAAGGARFSQFYTSARCCPSRASLLTGLSPHRSGIGSFTQRTPREGMGPAYAGRLLPDVVTLPELLSGAGYATYMVGKWHLGLPGPIERGFDHAYCYGDPFAYAADQWDPGGYVRLPAAPAPAAERAAARFYATDAFSDYAVEFLRQGAAQGDRPWFLYLAHSSPHFPVQAPLASIEAHVERYRRGWDALRAERFARSRALGLVPADAPLPPRSMVPVDDDALTAGFGGQPNPAWDTLDAERREDLAWRMATYAAMVEHVDRGVGRLLDALAESGELEDTLVLFLSDNGACYEWGPFGFDGPSRSGRIDLRTGEGLRTTGQRGSWSSYGSAWADLCNTPLSMYKHFCHEGGLASPLLVRWPERFGPRPGWVTDPSHVMDVTPTILDAAGIAPPTTFAGRAVRPLEGVSLLGPCQGRPLAPRALAFEHQGARALRMGRHKVVFGKREGAPPRWRLFDVFADRMETTDLATAAPELTARLVAEWEAWARRVGAEPFPLPGPALPGEDASPRPATPALANADLEVTCEARRTGERGVLVAQGGRRAGFALHLVENRLAFDVRIDGQVHRVVDTAPAPERFVARATLDGERMALFVDGELRASAPSPGRIPVQPTDPLDVGRDTLTAAGDYEAPNPFEGTVLDHRVVAVPAAGGEGPARDGVEPPRPRRRP